MTERIPQKDEVFDEPPPFLGSWNRVYVAVLSYLAIVIALLYMFSRAATR